MPKPSKNHKIDELFQRITDLHNLADRAKDKKTRNRLIKQARALSVKLDRLCA